MNFAEKMLSKKLKEAEPALDPEGLDRKVLQIACEDFAHYLKINQNFTPEQKSTFDLNKKMEELNREDHAELESFLTIWTGIWLKKWKLRIRLLIGKQNTNETTQAPKTQTQTENQWQTLECREEIIEAIASTLIKNAEICGTRIIAEQLLKTEISKRTNQDLNAIEQILTILNNTLHKAREMTQKTGPLIYVKIDNNYYCQLKKINS